MTERYSNATTVTKSDTADIGAGYVSDALWIGTAGDGTLSVVMADGKTQAFAGITAGYHKLAVKRVNSTGSGVSNIVALKQ